MRHIQCLLATLLSLSAGLLLSANDPAHAQERPRRSPASTRVRFELLIAPGTTGIDAQRWGPVFQKLGETARFRQPLLDDRPEISETMSGRTREVNVVGELRPNGTIAFPGHTFRLTDTRKLAEWIRELKTYGAQGSPDGRPGFGLNATQLEVVLRSLEAPVAVELAGLPIAEALQKFGLPASLPARLSVAAEEQLSKLPEGIVAPGDLRGISRGTALAILLSRAQLGFRPTRTPSGSLELEVLPLGKTKGLWPVGWPLDRPPVQVAPKYVEAAVFDLKDKPFAELLDEARKATGVRILIDVRRIAEAELSLSAVKVTQRPRRMTWSGILDRGSFPDLMPELLQDEAGNAFVWVTTRTIAQMNERNKQRDAQAKAGGR
jgi:hypothetical protein